MIFTKGCYIYIMTRYLANPEVYRWVHQPIHSTNSQEKLWGQSIIDSETNQWTTRLGESLVREIYETQTSVWRPKSKNGFRPDWETPEHIIEVKTRNWTTSGTAGEKILGCPYKYADIPELYGKPLRIVCVAYQETDSSGNAIWTPSPRQDNLLEYWRNQNIEFVKATDLIREYHILEPPTK